MIIDRMFECLTCETCVKPVEVYSDVLRITCPQGHGQVLLSVAADPNQARLNVIHYIVQERFLNSDPMNSPQREHWSFYESLDSALQFLTQYGDLFRVKDC